MRLDFLSNVPSEMKGQQGSFFIDESNKRELMPRITFLQSLCDYLELVVNAQRPDLRQLLLDYVAAMNQMIGSSPQLELTDDKIAGKN